MRLNGRRVLVLGASSGLGRVIGIGLAREGARLALAARRGDLVEAAAKAAGNGATCLTCDVSDEVSCKAVIDEAVERLGGLDAVIFSAAQDPLVRLADAHARTWAEAFAINVTGATLVTRAAIPHLTASRGKAVYLSSMAGPATPPWPGLAWPGLAWPGLGVYGVTKAALERLVDSWRVEHPEVGFTTLILGPSGSDPAAASEFGRDWDISLATEMMMKWTEMDHLKGAISPADLTQTVVTILAIDALLPLVTILPRA
jgi:NAD(P)-dependent dehydrogenase (short-subunit alcohol dehydrogenase family)